MTIHLKPDLEAILKAQVEIGNYASIEEALEAAVRSLIRANIDPNDDLSWAKPYLDEADAEIAAGRTLSHDEVWADLEQRLGKL